MRILVDADACPVVKLIEKTAERYGGETVLFCDTNHVLYSEYSTVKTIGAGADAVDFALTAECRKGDIVVTQDYGVAAMILSKGAYGLHQSSMRYTNENIDRLLAERHMAKKARMSRAKHHMKGPKKRTQEDDARFLSALETLLAELSGET